MDFIKEIKAGKIKRAYLFYGEEEYLKKFYSEFVLNTLIKENARAMNFDTFEGKNCSVAAIEDAFTTLPFMSDYRVLLIKNSGLFYSGRKDASEALLKSIEYLPETSVLVFAEEKLDKRSRLYKKINEIAMVLECKAPSEKDLVSFVKKIFNEQGFRVPTEICLYLLRTVTNSMDNIISETRKLIDYKFDEKKITSQDIDDICIKSSEVQIFDLLKAVGNKKSEDALLIYRDMITMKEEPIMIISMMARQFRMILQSVKMKQSGKSDSEICSELGIRGFALKEYISQGHNFTEKTLINALKDLLDTDVKIKTGSVNNVLGVELLIIKYSASNI